MKRSASISPVRLQGMPANTVSVPMAPRSSFRRRLALRMMFLCVALLAIALLVVFLAVRQALWYNLDRMLISIARSEIASSLDGPRGQLHTHDDQSIALELKTEHDYEKFVQIVDRSGAIVARTKNVPSGSGLKFDPRLAEMAWTQGSLLGNVWHGDQLYRGLYYRLHDLEGTEYLAVIAMPRDPVLHLLWSLAFVLCGTLLTVGVAAAILSVKLAARLTRPLEQIAHAANAVQEADLSARIPAVSQDAELQNVTAGLNAMLARLETAFGLQQQMLEGQRRFTADASHELRTPLTNLQGHLEVALRRPRAAEDYQQTLAIALAETQRMARLVADLLTLSRADADTLALQQRPCNLSELAAQAAAAFFSKAESAEINLCVEGPAQLPIVADPDRLRQAIDNLLDNALRYAPRGTQVKLQLDEQPSEARLSVVDAGPGLTPDEQVRAFERFYRTDPSRTSESGGTGLGLSIAKAIVEAHGGRIGVDSHPGVRTAFTIVLKTPELP